MAHIFSVEIHEFLGHKIRLAEKGKNKAVKGNDEKVRRYFEGQLLELNTMRRYLSEKIDLKNRKYY
ncbi:MAG TPA: hypothetical protein ENK84_01665 [Desulfobulbus sp.]|nr:hypothetical protein [Desulfobulbus sp.]